MYHSKDTFVDNTCQIAFDLRDLYDSTVENDIFRNVFEPYVIEGWKYKDTVLAMFFADILKCADRLGHLHPDSPVFDAILFCYFYLKNINSGFDYQEWILDEEMQDCAYSYMDFVIGSTYYQDGKNYIFIVVDALMNAGYYGCAEIYYQSIYDFAYALAYADGAISSVEKEWLKVFDQYHDYIEKVTSEQESLYDSQEKDSTITTSNLTAETKTKSWVNSATETCEKVNVDDEIEKPIEVLNDLIGLYPVKSDITSLRNLIKMQKIRESKGMKTAKLSYHCVFTGNPGTGKTTVARILAGIYKELGLLRSGHLVETDRSGLVADYIGQTATKTNAIIDKALDGVLFIDEAYALAQGGDLDFGKEAISTLLKRMEDDRNRLVVILAGYNKEMGEFINSNSGLQSRFSRYIDFPDYEIDELVDIFNLFLKQNQYVIEDKAMEKVKGLITEAFIKKDEKFGNARYVRNLFEAIITNQANRLSMLNDIDEHTLSMITAEDI